MSPLPIPPHISSARFCCCRHTVTIEPAGSSILQRRTQPRVAGFRSSSSILQRRTQPRTYLPSMSCGWPSKHRQTAKCIWQAVSKLAKKCKKTIETEPTLPAWRPISYSNGGTPRLRDKVTVLTKTDADVTKFPLGLAELLQTTAFCRRRSPGGRPVSFRTIPVPA